VSASAPILSVRDLSVALEDGWTSEPLVRDVSFDVHPGETVGIVGESGSGKSLSARAIMRLLPPGLRASGSVTFGGQDVLSLPERRMARLRGAQLAMLFQDPFTMLNPLLHVGAHISETRDERRGRAAAREAVRRLAEVGIHDEDVANRYPFQLSGGMRQRAALAAALARDPMLLIADEPSTALDVTTQAEILKLLKSVQQDRGMGLVLITHDLRVAFSVCDRVCILYAGSTLELAPADRLAREPLHPYALGLLMSEPSVTTRQSTLAAIEGSVPALRDVAGMCSFAPRCRWQRAECLNGDPPLRVVEDGRLSACVRIEEIRSELAGGLAAPSVEDEPVAFPKRLTDPLVSVDGLVKVFGNGSRRSVHALRGVSLDVGRNESVALVGESGSGKSTLGRCLVGLETPTDGSIVLGGVDVSDYRRLSRESRAKVRHTVQMIFQDPYSSLDPMQTIGSSLREIMAVDGVDRRERELRAGDLLELVGLPVDYGVRRPAALSGGERQRVAIARALANRPSLLVCDEPVSALDVSVQAQILTLFRSLKQSLGLSYLFITHDLAVVRQIADRVYVLCNGEVVESGPVKEILDNPQHEYTMRLIASIPRVGAASELAYEPETSESAGRAS
jgi:peptide/nickel transport system ATP-binding protein